jgi:hypothetical protein
VRLHYDEEERARLVQRFCDSSEVTNAELASCIQAELEGLEGQSPRPKRPRVYSRRQASANPPRPRRQITARDWEDMQGFFEDDGGYLDDPNNYGRG